MRLKTICKHLAKNNLSEEEIEQLLRRSIEPARANEYAKGYMRSIGDAKRHREARKARRDKEFKAALDFISDLTHEKA